MGVATALYTSCYNAQKAIEKYPADELFNHDTWVAPDEVAHAFMLASAAQADLKAWVLLGYPEFAGLKTTLEGQAESLVKTHGLLFAFANHQLVYIQPINRLCPSISESYSQVIDMALADGLSFQDTITIYETLLRLYKLPDIPAAPTP